MKRLIFSTLLLLVYVCINLTSHSLAQTSAIYTIPDTYKSHPEYGMFKYESEPNSYELIHLRKINERVFTNEKGQLFHQTINGAFHYLDANNNLLTIQTEPELKNGKVGIFKTDLPIITDNKKGNSKIFISKEKFIEFGKQTQFDYLDSNLNVISTYSSNKDITKSQLSNTELTQKNIFPKIDRIQDFNFWSLKTDFRLNERISFAQDVKYVSLSDVYELPQSFKIVKGDGRNGEFGFKGDLNVVDEKGNVVSTISRAIIYDSYKSKEVDKKDLTGHVVLGEYVIEKISNGFKISILVPTSYLNDSKLVYPVVIDPTVTNLYAGNSGLQGVNVQFNANCQQQQSVTLPAGNSWQVSNTSTQYTIRSKGYIDTEWLWGIIQQDWFATEDEQRSRVGYQANWTPVQAGVGQSMNPVNVPYNINTSNIANGCYAPNSVITYTWQGYNTYFPVTGLGQSQLINVPGCVTVYQELVANTWRVTTTYDPVVSSFTYTPQSPSICNGQTLNIALSSSIANTTFAWTVVETNTSGASNGNGATINQTINLTSQVAGTVVYTVTPTHGSCVGTPQNITVNVTTGPVIDAGVDVSICQGQPVTLSASGGTTYTWDNGVQDGVAFTPTQTTTYTVTSTGNGCVGTDQVVVTVDSSLIVDAGNAITICQGQSVTLSATGAQNYAWDNGVQDGVAFTPTQTTLYTVTGSLAVGNGCSGIDTVSVIVIPFVLDPIPDVSICSGSPLNVNITSNSPIPATFGWTSTAVNLTGNSTAMGNTITDILVSSSLPASATYHVIGDNGICQSAPIQFVVSISSAPIMTPVSPINLCSDTPLNINLSSDNPQATYSWTFTSTANVSGATAGTGNTITDLLTLLNGPSGTVTYTVTPSLANCQGLPINIDVNISNSLTINAGQDVIVCEGSSVTLSATGATSYTWNNGVQNGVPFVPTSSGSYIVSATTGLCTGSDTLNVTVIPLQDLSFQAGAQKGCQPFTVSFTSPNTNSNGTCLWLFGDGSSSSNCQLASNTFQQPGCYDVKYQYTSPEGCVSEVVYQDYICVYPTVQASFAISNNNLSMLNSTTQMVNSSIGATSYIWNFGDFSAYSNIENPYHSFPIDSVGTYQVSLIAYNDAGCSDTAYVMVTVEEDLIYFIPNSFTPNGDEFNNTFKPVIVSGFDPKHYTFTIFNRWGEVLFVSHDSNFGWDGTYDPKSGIIQDGVYQWTMELKSNKSDEKIYRRGHVYLLK